MAIFNQWQNVRNKVFEMREKRSKMEYPPRDMPISVALNLYGWRSDNLVKKTFSWFDIDFEYGVDEDETSLNNMGYEGPGMDFYVSDRRGYWTLFRDFYRSFRDKILLNNIVKKIQYSDDVVTVITKDGQVFTADYALSTFSSGVLGSNLVEFDPPLPEWKKEAILRFRPVYYTKIFLKFPRDFWDDHQWIMHASRETGNFPAFLNLNRREFFPGSNILFSAAVGDEALRVEAQSDSKTLTEVMEALRKMYGPNIPDATGW